MFQSIDFPSTIVENLTVFSYSDFSLEEYLRNSNYQKHLFVNDPTDKFIGIFVVRLGQEFFTYEMMFTIETAPGGYNLKYSVNIPKEILSGYRKNIDYFFDAILAKKNRFDPIYEYQLVTTHSGTIYVN